MLRVFSAAIVILFSFMLLPIANADVINSSNYTVVLVVDEAGGALNSSSYKAIVSANSIFGLSNSMTYKTCFGYVCVEFGPRGEILSVTFLLEFNISGTSGDQGYVDTKGVGLYRPNNITKFFTCVQDPTLSENPVFGIVYAGTKLRYIRLDPGASFAMRLAQDQPGNKFVLPVTTGGCDVIRNKLPLTFPISPFGSISDLFNAVELIVSYPIDIVGDFERTGLFTLVLERNETTIIGKPR